MHSIYKDNKTITLTNIHDINTKNDFYYYYYYYYYLKGDIHEVGVELRSICMCLGLWVCPLQHMGHIHSTGVFFCHRRLWDTQTINKVIFLTSGPLKTGRKYALPPIVSEVKQLSCIVILMLENCVIKYFDGQLHANIYAPTDHLKEGKQWMKIKGIHFSWMN